MKLKKMEELFEDVSDDWKDILLNDSKSNRRIKRIYKTLSKEESFKDICPPPDKWFEFARLTELNNIKVVILGQDPYYTKGVAHGLAFSCKGRIPPSLRNIYKCLKNTGMVKKEPTTADLTHWATQGVLLLNMALSTELGKAGAHSSLWSKYMSRVLKLICDREEPLIFMLWGNYAKKIADDIPERHIIMKCAHPSPMAQGRLSDSEKFINCDHFSRANEILDEPIDWNIGIKPKTRESKYEDSDDEMDILQAVPSHSGKKSKGRAIKMTYTDGYRRSFLNTTGRTHVFFTDGSCNPNNRSPESVGGYGTVFVEGKHKDTIIYGSNSTIEYNASNNRAEGQAIISGLQYIMQDWDWDAVIIITDSNLWVNLITQWMPKWTEDVFEEKSNPDMTKQMWKLWNTIKKKGKTASIKHVRGHNAAWMKYPEGTWKRYAAETNDYADKLANHARKKLKRGEEIVVPPKIEV